MTNLGDSHQDGRRADGRTKTETDIGDSKAMTNLGDSQQDGHRAVAMTKAETGDSKAVTKLGDPHQDGHRTGDKTKAENNGNDSKEEPGPNLYADHRGPTQDGLHITDVINGLTRHPEEAIVTVCALSEEGDTGLYTQ